MRVFLLYKNKFFGSALFIGAVFLVFGFSLFIPARVEAVGTVPAGQADPGCAPATVGCDIADVPLIIASSTVDGAVSTTSQAFSGKKTFLDDISFLSSLTVSNILKPNAFTVTADGSIGIGIVPDATKQLHVKFDADKGALFDGRTNPRTVTVGSVRFEHTAGIEGTKPVFYDIDAAGYSNTHATEVVYKTGAMTGISNVHDIIVDGVGAIGATVHGLKIDVINPTELGRVVGLGTDPHTDPVRQYTGAYIHDVQSWYDNLSTYTNITDGIYTIFNIDESFVYIGSDTAFTDIQVNLSVVASQNINPVFSYWNGSVWSTVSPSDGTNGFSNSGVISVSGLTPNWATTTVNGVSKYYIQIRRTRNALTTSPRVVSFLTNEATQFYWDKTGKLKINTFETIGNVGIGTATPGYLLTMGIGGGYYNQSTGAWINGSDRVYKDNILTLEKYGLETIMGLRPVSYTVKQSGIEQVGFIAQEVRDIVPELVSGQDGSMGVNYGGLTPILAKAIQEIASISGSFRTSITNWFASATNGIGDFFARRYCSVASDGKTYCLTGDDIKNLGGVSVEVSAEQETEPEVSEVIEQIVETTIETEETTTTTATSTPKVLVEPEEIEVAPDDPPIETPTEETIADTTITE